MKKRLMASAMPLVCIALLSLTAWQGKGNKEQGGKGQDKDRSEQHGNGGGGSQNGNSKSDHGNNGKQHGNSGKAGQGNGAPSKGSSHKNGNGDHVNANGNAGSGNPDKGNPHQENTGANGKKNGKGHREKMDWATNSGIDWNLNNTNYQNRNNPKKVTICHKTGDSGYPVNITVSQNALKAHLNHGDQVGNCNFNYQGWPANYIQSRETVYNQYETTWETMSYGEALVRLALNKILGLKSNLTQVRSTLSPEEIRRREALIYELQTNTNNLQNQVGATREQLSLVSININL